MIDKQAILQEVVELSGVPAPVRDFEFTAAEYAEIAGCSTKTAKRRLDEMVKAGTLRSGERRDDWGRPVTAYWRIKDEEELKNA